MHLDSAFVRLPLRFDAARLAEEVLGVPEERWVAHPQGHQGNTALPLLAVNGDPSDDGVRGVMAPTPNLEPLEYLRQVLAALEAPIGRTRLMRIDGHERATPHSDTNYYWYDRLRVHIPIVTTPGVMFLSGDQRVHMGAGECWVFDTWSNHDVVNPADDRRIHLVVDTVGSGSLWQMIDAAASGEPPADRAVAHRAGVTASFATEVTNLPVVMSPEEVERLSRFILSDAAEVAGYDAAAWAAFDGVLRAHLRRWRSIWARHGASASGVSLYGEELSRLQEIVGRSRGLLRQTNGTDVAEMILQYLVRPAIAPDLLPIVAPRGGRAAGTRRAPSVTPRPGAVERRTTRPALVVPDAAFDRPVIIVSPPRAGSSMLFETLSLSPSVHTIGGESHGLMESLPELHPARAGFDSNRLVGDDATPAVAARLRSAFLTACTDRDGRPPVPDTPVRLLEKTPKNALRVPFLDVVFPDARFVYLYRDPRQEISSMLDGWRSGRFVTYPQLPGWNGLPWSFLLVPGWRDLDGRSLPEIVARQWSATTSQLLDDLEHIDPDRWCVASYEAMTTEPEAEVERLCRVLGLAWDRPIVEPLPLARHTLTPPDPDKWRHNEAELEPILPLVAEVAARAQEVFGEVGAAMAERNEPVRVPAAVVTAVPTQAASAAPSPTPAAAAERANAAEPPFRSVHTPAVPELLAAARSSVLVSTYQSGRLIVLRPDEGVLNTHFVGFPRPMGVAVGSGGRLSIGTQREVVEYRNQAAAIARLTDAERYDACFLPRRRHTTGDISIHDMAYGTDGLWVVNTRFSCLCTLDADHSFVPRWRPPFITALAGEDRCHLNGLAMVDGRPRWVTALGTSDEKAGWRDRKAFGGVVIDVGSGVTVAEGLSMPHSPRWYGDRLWVLESGRGALVTVDPATGAIDTVAEVPGFTRGLAFLGPYALIGLSQVRESVFGGLPLTEREIPRNCGVWVVDTRDGRTVGFVRFEGVVQEIFDVQVLAGRTFPELVETDADLPSSAFVVPQEALVPV